MADFLNFKHHITLVSVAWILFKKHTSMFYERKTKRPGYVDIL